MRQRWRFYLPVLAFLILGWSWAFASPVGSSADENFHLTSAWCAWGAWEDCTVESSTGLVTVPAAVGQFPCFAGGSGVEATCLLEQEWQETFATTHVSNPTGGYPPLFHATMRFFAGPDVEKSVVTMRMFNVAIAAAVLLWALILAPPVVSRALALTWAIAIIPIGLFFVASVNPSSWAIIGGSTFWAFFYTLLAEPRWRSLRSSFAMLGMAVTMVLAVMARADSVYVIVLSVVAVGIIQGFFLRNRLKSFVLLAFFSIAAIAIALRFNVGSYLSALNFSIPVGNQITDQPNPLIKVLAEIPAFLAGAFGLQEPWAQRESISDYGVAGWVNKTFLFGLGNANDVVLPSLVGVLVLVVVSGSLFLGLSQSPRAKLAAVAILFTGMVFQILAMRSLTTWGSWETSSYVLYIYPRYLLPALMLTIAISLVVTPISKPIFGKIQGYLISILLTLAATVALMATIGRYMQGQDRSWVQFETASGWWWSWGPDPILIICLSFVSGAIYFGAMVSLAVRFPTTPEDYAQESRQGTSGRLS